MTANENTDDWSKEFNDRGSVATDTALVRDVFAAVDTPARETDAATLSVKGFALDDEPGEVVIAVRGDASTTIVLELGEARALADAIATTAAEVSEADSD